MLPGRSGAAPDGVIGPRAKPACGDGTVGSSKETSKQRLGAQAKHDAASLSTRWPAKPRIKCAWLASSDELWNNTNDELTCGARELTRRIGPPTSSQGRRAVGDELMDDIGELIGRMGSPTLS